MCRGLGSGVRDECPRGSSFHSWSAAIGVERVRVSWRQLDLTAEEVEINLPGSEACGIPAHLSMCSQAIKYYTIDGFIALFVAFLINVAVVSTFARHYYAEECARASTLSACFAGDSYDPSQPNFGKCENDGFCQEIGLSAAAEALKGSLQAAAKYIWAVGLLVRNCWRAPDRSLSWRGIVGGSAAI